MIDPATIIAFMPIAKFFSDMAVDFYIDGIQKGYTPEQLLKMIETEEGRKKVLDASWDQMKANAGV